VISVVDLQNSMDLLSSGPGSTNETRGTSTLDGKEVTGIEAERVLNISEIADQETTVPAIQTEPNEKTVLEVSVMDISYRLNPELPAVISVCSCEIKMLPGNVF
jgi:hypothetical protein